jgi:hypothetical protein
MRVARTLATVLALALGLATTIAIAPPASAQTDGPPAPGAGPVGVPDPTVDPMVGPPDPSADRPADAATPRLTAPKPVTELRAGAPANDDGRHLRVAFTRAADDGETATVVFRRPHSGEPPPAMAPVAPLMKLAVEQELAGWTVVALLEAGEASFTDTVDPDGRYDYLVVTIRRDDEGRTIAMSRAATAGPAAPRAAWFARDRWPFLLLVLIIAGLFAWYLRIARRRPQDIYIRRMPGVDAIEDAVGRSTEMGRPVLYVTGIEDVQDIMTIASLLILGHVAELTAAYDTEIKVANYYPITMVVAEEVVRAGYAKAGRADAHRPDNVLFITAEQFAFAAGVNGIILRDRPATNIYFGRFYGESLLLAETGFVTGAVQIAGTAELTQLPFFVAACDYALIGEELYATSAYLAREPSLLANVKAGDGLKLVTILFIVVGAALATTGTFDLAGEVFP